MAELFTSQITQTPIHMQLKYHAILLIATCTVAFDTAIKAQGIFSEPSPLQSRAFHLSMLEKQGEAAKRYFRERTKDPSLLQTVVYLQDKEVPTYTATNWRYTDTTAVNRITMQLADTGICYTETGAVEFTPLEKDLQAMQKAAFRYAFEEPIADIPGTFIRFIPIISEKFGRKCYILRRSTEGKVIFGDDRILEFDTKNNLIHASQVHDSITTIEYLTIAGDSIPVFRHEKDTTSYTETDLAAIYAAKSNHDWYKFLFVSGKEMAVWNFGSEQIDHIPHKKNKSKQAK